MVQPKLGINSTYDFFFEVAYPNLREYHRSPSARSVMNAAWTLWHVHEWYFWEQGIGEDVRSYGENLASNDDKFYFLKDIADASEHFNLTRKKVPPKVAGTPRVLTGVAGLAPAGITPAGVGMFEFVVEANGKQYDLDLVFGHAYRYWLGKVLPYLVDLPRAADSQAASLSERMLAWCRKKLGDEQTVKPKWAYWGGRNPPDRVRFSFHEEPDAEAFRSYWEPLVRSSPPG